MVSSMPCCRSALANLPSLALRLLVAATLTLSLHAQAQGIFVKSAELAPTEAGYTLDATYDVVLTPTLVEALSHGVALTFVTEFEVLYPRWWTFNLWNRVVSEFRTQHKLSFHALTRQYRLSFGALSQNFDSLSEALAVIGRVRYSPAVRYQEVDPGRIYTAALRLRLDTSQLAKPLQIDALGSSDWNLSSDWYRWTFKP
jgi:uncharacterized protein DUF4390